MKPLPKGSIHPASFCLALSALLLCCGIRTDATSRLPQRMLKLPRLTVWAWEQPRNLTGLNTRKAAIAYLDQTVTIGVSVQPHPRRDPVVFPANAVRIPVVRIQTKTPGILDREAREQVVKAILISASQPGISALQVDFDATRSQRDFYRALLIELRRQMPANLPLSITALASWCSYDDWLRGLPIDEAVPMFFRMEPDRHRTPADLAEFRIREPVCQGSAGISTAEATPPYLAGKRIYVFPENSRPRTSEVAVIERKIP